MEERGDPQSADRLTQAADLVLVLALMHHLRITGGIPFTEIVALLGALTRRHVVFEIVPPTDTMFAAMARGREPLYTDCEPARAEAAPGRKLHGHCGARHWKMAACCCCSRSAERLLDLEFLDLVTQRAIRDTQ